MESQTVRTSLVTWQRLASAGKREATQLYHAELVKIFNTHFPNLDSLVCHIEPSHIADFVERVAHYSAPRFNAVLGTLRKVIPHAPKIKRRRVTPKIVNLPGSIQFSELLALLDRAPRSHAGLMVRFLALTGLRIGEARKLKWTDIQPSCLLIPGALTKNGKPKAVPLMAGLGGVIERLRAVGDEREVIFPQASVKRALATACALAGVVRMTHHDMRRLFATRCIESGVDMPTAARWMGHSDGGALLAKSYFHLLDAHSREMALKVAIF